MGVQTGMLAPDFSGLGDDGRSICLADLRGRWVILYFYPKAGTRQCSLEAIGFEAALPELQELGAEVIGISADSPAALSAFRQEQQLSFALLPDPRRHICHKYGVLTGFLSLIGLASRRSFIISPQGILAAQWQKVDPPWHATEVVQWLTTQASAAQPSA